MAAISELAEDGVVEGTFAVARKQRLRTRSGSDYLAIELVDKSGRIEGRVWHDVDLLDGRFSEGDAVRVLGRVERFRNHLQLDVRAIELAEDADPVELTPALRRDADELEGFLEFLVAEITHPGLKVLPRNVLGDAAVRKALRALPATPESHHVYAGGLLEHTVGVATICRELCQLHPRLRGTSSWPLRCSTISAGRSSSTRAPASIRPLKAACWATSISACGSSRNAAGPLDVETRSELLHAIASHHDARSAMTAEAACLYHANQLDALAATRPVE